MGNVVLTFLFMALIFHKMVIKRIFILLKSTSEISYKTLKLCEIHDFIFTNVYIKIHETFVL